MSVPLREQSIATVSEEAERLVEPLEGLYGKAKRLLGFESIRVWVQLDPDGPRLNIYLESRESIGDTLEAGRGSTNPLDIELMNLFQAVTGRTWDSVVGLSAIQILDWSAEPLASRSDQEQEGS